MDRTYDVLIILEAPGQEEDSRGVPTVGEAGKLLTNFILRAGFDQDQIFIDNSVRCRPPYNRTPTVQEINACYTHVEYIIRKIKPKVIMLLGAVALRVFNLHNQGGINKTRGKIFKMQLPTWPDGPEFTVIPTLHPASFLHQDNPKAFVRSQDDYILAANVARGEAPNPCIRSTYKLIRTVKEAERCIEEMREKKLFVYDTESRSLPWLVEPLTTFSFCWGYDDANKGKSVAILPVYRHRPIPTAMGWKIEPYWIGNRSGGWEKIRPMLKALFEDETIAKGGHNLKYDNLVVKKWCDINVKGTLYDTLLMYHMVREQRPHDLQYLCDLEFAVGDWEAQVHRIVGSGKKKDLFDNIPDHVLWRYAGMDAECCYRLLGLCQKYLSDKPHLLENYYEEVMPLIYTIQEAEWYGLPVDFNKLDELDKHHTLDLDKCTANLISMTWADFNPASPPQVQKAITQAGFGEQIKNDKAPSGIRADKDVLLKLQDELPLARELVNWRSKSKNISNFITNVRDMAKHDGRLHSGWLIHGTENARLSNYPLHQIPRNDENSPLNYRDAYVSPPGYSFVIGDMSQIELKVLAIAVAMMTGDTSFMEVMFDPDTDAHKSTASLILGIPVDKINKFNRNVGKTVNFGLAYGSEGYELVKLEYEDLSGAKRLITFDMVKTGMDNFFGKHYGLKEYMAMVPDIARAQNGVYINLLGREKHMGPKLNSKLDKLRGDAERELINFTIQSVADQISHRTMNIVKAKKNEWVKEGRLKEEHLYLSNTVHDMMKYTVIDSLAPWFKGVLSSIASREVPQLLNKRFTCNIGIGKSWTEADKNSKV